MTRDSSRKFIWGGVAVVVIAAAVLYVATRQAGTSHSPGEAVAQKVEPAAPPAVVPPKPVATSPQPTPVPPPTAGTAAPNSPTALEAPRFDIVRVDPSGHAVLAGRAAPGSVVTIFDGATEIGHATADKDGNWVLVLEQPLPPGQSQLTLSSKGKDGKETRSDGVVAMLVPDRATTKPAATPAVPPATTTTTTAAAATPEPTPKTEAPIAVLVPKEGQATALQLPPLKGGDERLSMDIIEYGTKGDVILEGRAAPNARVDAFLDNKKVGSATTDQDGKWRIVTTDSVPAGRYKLKLESHGADGKELAQLTLPFERANVPEQVAADLVIVQPGNSLWRIARRSYGHGKRYVEIYHANRRLITNPQLIYPGQLLQIPGKS